MEGRKILDLSDKLADVLQEAQASPADGNTALLYTLVASMQVSRPELSAEAVAGFLYRQVLSLAEELKRGH